MLQIFKYLLLHLLWIIPLCAIGKPGNLSTDSLYQKAVRFKKSAQYDSAFYYFDNAESGFRAEDNWGGVVQCQYGIGGIYTDMGKYRKAEEILLQALHIGYTHLDTLHIAIADAHSILGYNYSQMPRLREAEKHYLTALDIFKRLLGEVSVPVGNAYAGLGAVYYLMKDANRKAIGALIKSIDILKKADSEHSIEMARSYNELANIYHQEEQLDSAINFHRKSLLIKQEILRENHPEIGVSYYNLAQAYLGKGDLEQAIIYYKNTLSIDIITFGKEHRWVAEDYSNIAQCYYIKGSYELAMQYARKASDILRNAYGENDFRVARTYSTIGINHYAMQHYAQAVSSYEKALDILSKLPENNISIDMRNAIALGHNRMGLALTQLKDYQAAILHHEEALAIYKDTFHAQHSDVGLTYMYIGDIYMASQKFAEALNYYEQALSVLQISLGENHPEVGRCLGKIGKVYLDQGSYAKALLRYQKALKGFAPDYQESDVYKHPVIPAGRLTPVVLHIINGKAQALKEKYQHEQDLLDLEFSWETSQFAANLIDTLRISYLESGSQQNLSAGNMEIYETGIATAYELYQITQQQSCLTDAFTLAERSKSFLLLSALQDSEAKHFAGIPDSVLQQEKDLKITLAFYEKKSQEAEDIEKEAFWRNKAFDAKQSYDSLIKVLANTFPRYHQLKYNTTALDLNTLQKKVLGTKDVLLEYYWGDDHIFLFVIDQHHPFLFKIDQNELLTENINAVRNIIANKLPQPTAYSEKSYFLYQQLIAPADSLIQDKNLLIIPDGPLSYLPFEVLPDKPSENASFFSLPYLVKNHSLHYAFSATVLAENSFVSKEKTPDKYIAFAPEFTARVIPASSRSDNTLALQDTLRGSLVPLEGAAREIYTINQVMEGEVYEGVAAHEGAFKEHAENYGIIHLATHAIVDDQNPLNSRMLFTVTEDSTEDGNLYAWELYNMQLRAQMVVLSACNTGFGKLQRGEGVMSLGRAFAYAGCPSVIMSLWPAQDQATADLMDFFYAALTEGLPKNEALRQAKLQYLAQSDELFAHPFYWAGFVVQGNPDPIQLENSFSMVWLIGGFLVLLSFLFFLIKVVTFFKIGN